MGVADAKEQPTRERGPRELQVMQAVAARDQNAFAGIVDEHARTLHRIAYRMLGDGAEAEDVAQETLLRLWDHADRWRDVQGVGGGGQPGIAAWLRRVAMNLCLDRLRRKRFSSDEDVPERIDDAPSADSLIDEDRIRRATIAVIGALPERQRAAIMLTYYEDLSNQLAADSLDMNVKAFESLLLRARRALRDALEAQNLVPDFVDGGR